MFSSVHIQSSVKRMILILLFAMLVAGIAVPTDVAAAPTESVHTDGTQRYAGPVLMVTDYAVGGEDRGPGSSIILQMNLSNLST